MGRVRVPVASGISPLIPSPLIPQHTWSSSKMFTLKRKLSVKGDDSDIHEAVDLGHLAKVQELVERNPEDLETRGHAGNAPLHLAARRGNLELVKYLLEARA